jgi:hypothetical protein
VTTTGELIFSSRVEQHFTYDRSGFLRQFELIYLELQRRILEGVPIEKLNHGAIIYSLFNGQNTQLFSINTASFFDVLEKDKLQCIYPNIQEIQANQLNIHCFKPPTDLALLQYFQQQLKPFHAFQHDLEAIEFYILLLKQIFIEHARLDPSITSTFDLFIQSYRTGKSLMLYVDNPTQVKCQSAKF